MIKSINSWSFNDPNDVKYNAALSAKAGFEAIELALTPEEGPVNWNSSESELRAVRKTVEESGLQIASLAIGTGWAYPLSSPDKKIAETGMDSIRKGLVAARALGTDGILIVPGTVTPEVSYEEVWSRTQDRIADLVDDAKAAGVAICVENVWNKFHLSPIEMRDYVDSFDSEYVKVYLDVGNMLLYGYPQQWIRTLGSRIKKVHFKDFRTSVGNGGGFVGLLEGDVDWPEVMKAFDEIGYDGPASVEIGPYEHHWQASVHVISLQMDFILGRRSE
jgi:L-ribulose-5-phosphate 3-epimerase